MLNLDPKVEATHPREKIEEVESTLPVPVEVWEDIAKIGDTRLSDTPTNTILVDIEDPIAEAAAKVARDNRTKEDTLDLNQKTLEKGDHHRSMIYIITI